MRAFLCSCELATLLEAFCVSPAIRRPLCFLRLVPFLWPQQGVCPLGPPLLPPHVSHLKGGLCVLLCPDW